MFPDGYHKKISVRLESEMDPLVLVSTLPFNIMYNIVYEIL